MEEIKKKGQAISGFFIKEPQNSFNETTEAIVSFAVGAILASTLSGESQKTICATSLLLGCGTRKQGVVNIGKMFLVGIMLEAIWIRSAEIRNNFNKRLQGYFPILRTA